MNSSLVKRNIISSFNEECPDILDNLKQKLANETILNESDELCVFKTEGKRLFILRPQLAYSFAACLLMFFIGMQVGIKTHKGNINDKEEYNVSNQNDGVTTLHFNAGAEIDIMVDSDMNILECISTDEETNAILQELNVVGNDLNSVIDTIIRAVNSKVEETSDLINEIPNVVDNETISDTINAITDETENIVQQTGVLLNEAGHLVNESGQLINEAGQLINESGQLIDAAGNIIDEAGQLIDAAGNIVDEAGNIIKYTGESGSEVIGSFYDVIKKIKDN